MDFSSLLGKNPSESDLSKTEIIKYAKREFPHLVYDSVDIEWDDSGSHIKNRDTVSALSNWQRHVMYNLCPKERPFILSHMTNGSGKSYLLALKLVLLLLDDHPSLSKGFMHIKGNFILLTNTSLLKSDYPNMFFNSPGFLGKDKIYKEQGFNMVRDSKGNYHKIVVKRGSDGMLSHIINETNGKSIRCFSYAVNEQKLAGSSPLSIFCDEFGDLTTTSNASGANKFTVGKFNELSVRVGRDSRVGDNWVFCMFFTLTLGESWIEDIIDHARGGGAIESLNKERNLPLDTRNIELIDSVPSVEANPFLNKSTIAFATGISEITGQAELMMKRLITTDGDDPSIVFPRKHRPIKISAQEGAEILEASKKEPGWMFVESIDPGWRDKCSVLFIMCHPVKGIYVLHEIYESGLTVPQVASRVKHIEYTYFENRKPEFRFFDPNHIHKTTQESPVANYKLWKANGLEGIPARHSRADKSYDRIFELLFKNLVKYTPINCKGLDMELRKHRRDIHGIPEERQNNHSIDALRYVCNWFYEDYAKKIHLTVEKEMTEIPPERAIYYQQLEFYRQFVKPLIEKEDNTNTVLGVKLKGISRNNIRGFRRS